jgi:molybdopterin biosynthesis enzyme
MFPLYEYDYLIITGGTSAAWANRIRETLKDMETLKIINGNCNDNIPLIFANVRGYYLYRMTKLSQRR